MPIPVKFSKGLSSATPSEIEPGRFKLQIDTGTLIFDNDDSSGAQYPTVQIADPTKLPLTGGALTGELNLSSNKVTGLAAPTEDTDAVNVQYANTNYLNIVNGGTIGGGQYNISGGVFIITGGQFSFSALIDFEGATIQNLSIDDGVVS